jgi:hypothetical protein
MLLGKVAFTPKAGEWNTAELPGINITKGVKYWVVPLGTGGILTFRDTLGGAYSPGSKSSTLATLPIIWSTGPSWYYGPASFYVD